MKCEAPKCNVEINADTNNTIGPYRLCGMCWFNIMNGIIKLPWTEDEWWKKQKREGL